MWPTCTAARTCPSTGVLANSLAIAVRNITFATALGSATLSSLTDLGRQQIHRRFAGVFKDGAHGAEICAGRRARSPCSATSCSSSRVSTAARRAGGLILESATHVLHERARYAGSFNGPMWTKCSPIAC